MPKKLKASEMRKVVHAMTTIARVAKTAGVDPGVLSDAFVQSLATVFEMPYVQPEKILSVAELDAVAKRMVRTKNPAKQADLKARYVRGFYGTKKPTRAMPKKPKPIDWEARGPHTPRAAAAALEFFGLVEIDPELKLKLLADCAERIKSGGPLSALGYARKLGLPERSTASHMREIRGSRTKVAP